MSGRTGWSSYLGVEEADLEATPYLHISSPEKRSGKSRLLEVVVELVRAPLEAANTSDAALFRAFALESPTLLLDEVDAVFGPKAR
jgi:hypothetical protein